MVSIIKNQLLKHLSRYTKNLSPDKVNLSTFRGEGELSNLQLDEEVLMDLLELPSWLRLTSAWCNHVTFRISWTKLKSTPITLTLDEVNIMVETCEVARSGANTPAGAAGMQGLAMPMGKYSFIHKIIDGITIVVNTVNVQFKSAAFTASVQMSRIRVESRTPKWMPGDLRATRLKDSNRGLLLIFKEMSWQTVRIEASSTQDKSLTPLRLLTNQARCRITIKKRLIDCSVVAGRLVLILDDLLWVLTDSQLKAALHFVDSLWGLIQTTTKATQRTKAQKKLETLPEYQAQVAQATRDQNIFKVSTNTAQISAAQKSFNMFDVHETSYHFFSQRIDLHLCDDEGDARSSYPDLKNGGALQISVHGFQIDFYPYHLAKSSRAYWPKYKEGNIAPALWLEQSLNAFRETILNISQPNRTAHAPLERTPNTQQQSPSAPSTPSSAASQIAMSPTRRNILDNLAKLMCSCVIWRVEEFTIFQVTTSGKKQMPREFIAGDKDRCSLPPDMSTLHAEFTYFYYPGDFTFPLPPSKVFVHINPVQINFDIDTCLWCSSFALNLHESLLRTSVATNLGSASSTPSSAAAANEPSLMYMDVKMEAILPRIVFESAIDAPQQRDRPKSMVVEVSRFAVTNIREVGSSRADLAQALHSLQEGSLVFASGFPSKEGDMCIVTDRILSHVAATDNCSPPNSPQSITSTNINTLSRYLLWSEPRDVWCVKVDPVWINFLGAPSIGQNRPVPFLDAVPITLWLHGKAEENTKVASELYNLDFSQSGADAASKRLERQRTDVSAGSDTSSLILSVNSLKQSLEYNSNSVNLLESFTNVQYKAAAGVGRPLAETKCVDSYNISVDSNSDAFAAVGVPSNGAAVGDVNDLKAPVGDGSTADLHVIAHVSNLVSVQIDHYQYLFLMRLAEEVTELSTFLSLDSKRIMKEKYADKSIIVGCVVPQVEVSLVMPSATPGKESSGGDAESVVLPDSASLGDDLHLSTTANSLGWPLQTPPANTSTATAVKNVISSSTQFPFSQGASLESPVRTEERPLTDPHIESSSGHRAAQVTPAKATITRTPSQATQPEGGQRMRSNRNSAVDVVLPFSKDLNSGLSSMKKGFSSFMTSIDSAIKNVNPSDDMSDTMSIRSDVSSDSENFIMVLAEEKTTDCMDVMFRLNPFVNDSNLKVAPVEVASEVCEDPLLTTMSSPSEPSEGSGYKRRDLVSMVTFRLTTVELIRQNKGSQSTARIQVAAINCDECGAIPWDEFQAMQVKKTKFGARCRAWNVAPYNPENPPCVGIRFEEDLDVPYDISNIIDKREVLNWFLRDLEVKVKNFNMTLSMSTLIGLGDLAEDEILPQAIPMNVDLENVAINLIEDRPPVNITSPGPVPINLTIGKMKITRDESGLFHIQPLESTPEPTNAPTVDPTAILRKIERDKELLSLQLVMQQLKMDNDVLRKQLIISEKTSDSHKNRAKQEIDTLKTYLKAAQDDVSTLLDEKRTLIDTIKSLQLQLTSNGESFGRSDKR